MGVSIQSVLDEDNTGQLLPDVGVVLNVTEPAGHVQIALLFLNRQVNYKAMEPIVQKDICQGKVKSCKVDFVFKVGIKVLQQSVGVFFAAVSIHSGDPCTLTTAERLLSLLGCSPASVLYWLA